MTPQLATILEPLIANRVVSVYRAVYRASRLAMADYQSENGAEEYTLFLQTVIVKRLTPLDSVNWLIDHPIVEAQAASQDVIRLERGEDLNVRTRTEVELGYLGYFYSILYGLDLGQVRSRFRRARRSDLSIALAAGLIAASTVESEGVHDEYELAMSTVFGVEYEDY